jgi:putative oxidoreductase
VTRIQNIVQWVQQTRDAQLTRDIALLVARILLAWLFIYHGAGTLFGAFHQSGLHGETVYFQSEHLNPAHVFALIDGTTQFVGGILIGVGILGRLAGLALAGDMIGAMATITFAQGLVGPNGAGYQINVALIIPSLVIALLGTGRYSLDELIGRRWKSRAASRDRTQLHQVRSSVHP